ncbi:MAG TPA: porin family protein, partial [Pseudolabrys sp.]|nr:porin family protein [Pseudolabrys sp.]
MRSAVIGVALAGALVSSSYAADLPVKAPAVLPAPIAPLAWTGWYAGVNAGYHWGSGSVATAADPGPFDVFGGFGPESIVAGRLATTTQDARQRGFIGGGQIGYNWKFAPQWVAGIEADIQGLAGEGKSVMTGTSAVPGFPTEAFSSTTQVTKKADWLATLRGRIG